MRRRGSIICDLCKHNEIERRYKTEVEKDGEYEYIRSYRRYNILPNGNIVKNSPYIQVRHKYCNSIYEVDADSFINRGRRCTKCCRTYENSFAYHIEVELGEPLEKYWDFERNTVNPYHIWKSGDSFKVWIKCQEKDYHDSYDITCYNFTNDRRCPQCASSKGEKRIKIYLDKNNILYIHDEPYFDDLLSDLGNPLRPDFILPEHKIWIEYDGEFHFKDFYKDGSYEILKEHDKRKDEYAKKHGWELIRISYVKFDEIETILNKKLKI